MDIILLKELDKVGGKHEIVKVKDGYGRNFLIPQGLAIVANAGNRKMLNELVKQEDKKNPRDWMNTKKWQPNWMVLHLKSVLKPVQVVKSSDL